MAEPQEKAPAIIMKFGEVTNTKMYQVRGDHHWYSTPQIAYMQHNKLKAFYAAGGFRKDKK